jgi:hypothetical protein
MRNVIIFLLFAAAVAYLVFMLTGKTPWGKKARSSLMDTVEQQAEKVSKRIQQRQEAIPIQ